MSGSSPMTVTVTPGLPPVPQPLYVTAAVNTSGHLILTKSDGTTIDAGLVLGKGISNVSFNLAGHFVVTYSDGSSGDLGTLPVLGIAGGTMQGPITLVSGIGGLIDSVNEDIVAGASSDSPGPLDHAVNVIASGPASGFVQLAATQSSGSLIEVHNNSGNDQNLLPSAGTQLEGFGIGAAVVLPSGSSVRCRLLVSRNTWLVR